MTPEQKGQHLILAAILILTLILSYFAIPGKSTDALRKDTAQSRWILRPYLANLIIQESENTQPAESETIVQETAQPETKEAVPAEKDPEPVTESAAVQDPEPGPETEAEPVDEGIILMNNPKYETHTKPIVKFTHQKHIDDYSISCGQCHHDDAGQPLDLQPGDPVAGCIDCHSETKKKKGEKLEKSEMIKIYHEEALHANCMGCHKAYNIEQGDPKGMTPAPASCKACHL